MKTLIQYSNSINNTMSKEGQRDVQFFEKLLALQNEASAIHSELKDKENRIYQLQQQRSELEKSLTELTHNQRRYPVDDYEKFLDNSHRTCQEAMKTRTSIDHTEKYLRHLNQDFAKLKTDIGPKSQLIEEIQQIQRQLEQNFDRVNPYLEGYPSQIHQTLHTLNEMGNDSSQVREKVRKQVSELNRINSGHAKLAAYFKNLYTMSFNNSWQTKANSAQTLTEELNQMKKTLKEQEAKVREVEECQGKVDAIRQDLTER